MPLNDPPGEFCERFPGSKIFGNDVLPLEIREVNCDALLSEVKSAEEAIETNESLTDWSMLRYDRAPGVAVRAPGERDEPSSAIDSEAGAIDTRRRG
jgi:hypothetical protein